MSLGTEGVNWPFSILESQSNVMGSRCPSAALAACRRESPLSVRHILSVRPMARVGTACRSLSVSFHLRAVCAIRNGRNIQADGGRWRDSAARRAFGPVVARGAADDGRLLARIAFAILFQR